jgi:hypothetical protein
MIYRRKKSLFLRLTTPLLVVFLCVNIFGLVWLRSQITSTEYRIGQLQKEKVEALKEEKFLYAKMSSMFSIQQVTTRGLELRFPDRRKVVYVKRDKGGVPYTASLSTE